ncbi:NAD(P)-dependent oxidoreductase [Mycobacterium sp. NPDC006124]|uniref:NAD(P)-dependent oxidoreductase n=1 Tax=Mycobacterium sp. NPDC006124 TaxID=3156729 RepID=UPI0033B4C21F
MASLGFIGLGTMGAGMARRLLDAGHDVVVWNRSKAAAEPLAAAGAHVAASVDEALQSDLSFSMLANDDAVLSVLSDDALASAPGGTHVNMATVSMDTARTLAAKHRVAGIGYVAAPVLGRPHLAASGQLNIVAAGASADVERARPFLDVLGKRIWSVGSEPERANLVKIAVNYNLIHTLQALAESVTMVERGGVAGDTFIEILTDAAYTGSAYGGYGPMIVRRRYEPVGFTVALGLKDLGLAEQAAADTGTTLPTSPTLRSLFESALADEDLSTLDWSAIAEVTRRL